MKQFIKYSRQLGENPAYIQGRGGNTSFKKNGLLYIKASGFLLKQLDTSNGYVVCRYDPIIRFLSNYPNASDGELNLCIKESIQKNSHGLPSIETGMHAVISSKYVIHTHSIYANVFNCMKNSEQHLLKVLPYINFLIIPYRHPGYELAKELFTLQQKNPLPSIIFLKNHGLIVHGNNLKKVISIHDNINSILKNYLTSLTSSQTKKIPHTKHLFPDSVIYLDSVKQNYRKIEKQEKKEICSAIIFISHTINALKEEIVYLSDTETQFIRNMEMEKYRLSVMQS